MLFSLALALDVQPEFFTLFVAKLANSQSGHPGDIFLVFVQSLIFLLGAAGHSQFDDRVDKLELPVIKFVGSMLAYVQVIFPGIRCGVIPSIKDHPSSSPVGDILR